MPRNVRLLFSKEMRSALRDRRTLILTVVFPLVFYPLVIAVMGRIGQAEAPRYESFAPVVAVVDRIEDPTFARVLADADTLRTIRVPNLDEALARLDAGDAQLALLAEAPGNEELTATLYFDHHDPVAAIAAARTRELLHVYVERTVGERLAGIGHSYDELAPTLGSATVDVATGEPVGRLILSRLLPYFLVLAILLGAMNLGAEITAGEKERGTIATLLVSQLKRTEIVVGKFLAVLTVSLVSSILSAVGLMVGLRFFGSGFTAAAAAGGTSGFTLGATQLGWMLVILVPLAVLIAALVMIVGSYARNQREASTLLIPVYMVIVLVGMSSMTGGAALVGARYYIPVAGALFALQEVILGELPTAHLLATLTANAVVGALLIAASVRLFRREEILFRS